ncbi:MAG: hypothetical protein RMK29_07325 [Myxococcales bacterium]|nr:hypothetical protein [Myxococcota bacterium]MDW8281504.1 hypothetical protein [Myxococcales bacterium]
MSMDMGKDGILCRLMPTEGGSMDLLRDRCETMMKMMSMGMPVMMMCGNMPMMLCTSATAR